MTTPVLKLTQSAILLVDVDLPVAKKRPCNEDDHLFLSTAYAWSCASITPYLRSVVRD